MLAELPHTTHPVDRHFLLMQIVGQSYDERKSDSSKRDLCEHFARQHLAEFPLLVDPIRERFKGELPRVSTFQHLATVLTEKGDYDEAIHVCEMAISYGLHDNTKGGFEARIARIGKQKLSARSQLRIPTPPGH